MIPAATDIFGGCTKIAVVYGDCTKNEIVYRPVPYNGRKRFGFSVSVGNFEQHCSISNGNFACLTVFSMMIGVHKQSFYAIGVHKWSFYAVALLNIKKRNPEQGSVRLKTKYM